MNPLVSFIIPVFNAELFIVETIDSALHCGYEPFEIILIDDGSQDSSYEICKTIAENHKNIHLYCHPNRENKGVAKTRKLGIEKSQGDFIYFLDADDKIFCRTLSSYIEVFLKYPDVVLVHGEIQAIIEVSGLPNPEIGFVIGASNKKYRLEDEPYYLKSDRICTSTVCVRKNAICSFSIDFSQIFPMGEDWLMWTILSKKGFYYYFAHPVVQYRVHENSTTFLSHQKGQQYLNYNLLEYYLCLIANSNDQEMNNAVKNNILDLMSDICKAYQQKEQHNKIDCNIFSQTNSNEFLKEKVSQLEKSWGYYFYFIFIIKNFWRKLFSVKKR